MTASTLTAKYPTSTARPVEIDYSRAPFFVRSKTTPNLFYTVVTTSDGTLRCECPARLNKKTRCCWHVSAVLSGIVKPAAWKRPAAAVTRAPMTADHSRPVSCDDLY